MQIAKFFATTAIPIAFMGFILPKINFSYTEKKINENKKNKTTLKPQSMLEFQASLKNRPISFTGFGGLANISDLEKMMILDGGLTVGRIKTGRNNAEKAEVAFKMGGMCFLNYVAPKWIEKGLNKITKVLFGINTDLDVKLLADKDFIQAIKTDSLEMPKTANEKDILDFVDNNPSSIFSAQAKKLKIVYFLDDKIRDPRKFVDIQRMINLKNDIQEFAKDALESLDVEKFAKKAIKAKSFNTFLNISLSSVLLALVLPKLQFLFRRLITGSSLDPAIRDMVKK